MKRRQKNMLRLFISILSLLLTTTPALAEQKVTVTPSNLTVMGTRCLVFNLKCTTVKRNLLLKTDQALTNPQILSLDLNRADGGTVLPATAIRPTLSSSSIQPNQPISIPVQFDFNQVQSGEYSGVLLVNYAGGELPIPITVRLKDFWLLPLLVLVLGVALGMGVSAYRAEGMARDEILVQVGRLRTQMRADSQLAQSFQTKIAGYLVDVETALENKRWEAAQQAVAQAQTVWDKWRKGREDWLAQLEYRDLLAKRLKDEVPNPDAFYMQVVRSQLENTVRETADKESPQQLRKCLEDLQQQINRYLQGQARLDQFNQLITEVMPDKEQFWKLKSQRFQQGLDSLSPTDHEAFNNWKQQVETAIEELVQALEQQATTEAASTPSLIIARSFNNTVPPHLLAPVPSARPLPDPVQAARKRLRWFNWLSYAIAVVLLAGAGFGQLYVAKPTFGANSWSDYFALFAWGFGAEVTRDAVTKVVRDWKLPGFK